MTLARFKFTLFFLTFLSFYLVGCSSLIRSTPGLGFLDSTPEAFDPGILKKVGLMPLRNLTDYQDATVLTALESKLFNELSSSCGGTIFIRSSDKSAPAFLIHPPQTPAGLIDSMDMALKCRQLGINMVLLASVTDIHYEKETSWYNWLIRDDDTIFLNIRVELFDAHTGTKIFHDTFMEERELRPLDVQSLILPEIMALPDFEKLSTKLIEGVVKQMCQTIHSKPWRGYIVSAEGVKGVISSGSEAGIKRNDEMQVYKNNGIITGFGGIPYIIPGQKVDQVRVTAVTKNSSEIVSTTQKKLSVDFVVQY